jgi:hypothetical protein
MILHNQNLTHCHKENDNNIVIKVGGRYLFLLAFSFAENPNICTDYKVNRHAVIILRGN